MSTSRTLAPGRGPKQSHLLIFTASVSVFLIDARMDRKTLKWIRRHMRVCRHIRWQGYARASAARARCRWRCCSRRARRRPGQDFLLPTMAPEAAPARGKDRSTAGSCDYKTGDPRIRGARSQRPLHNARQVGRGKVVRAGAKGFTPQQQQQQPQPQVSLQAQQQPAQGISKHVPDHEVIMGDEVNKQ